MSQGRPLREIADAAATVGGLFLFPPLLVWSVLASEYRLWAHVGSHRAPPESPAGRAIAGRATGAVARIFCVAALFGLVVLAFLVVFLWLLDLRVVSYVQQFIREHPEHAIDLLVLQGLAVLQLAYTVPYVAYLHLFRNAVRRHEELFAPLERTDDAWLGHAREDWSRRYTEDVLLSLVCVLPLVGVALLVLLAVRFTGALELHERHERAPAP